MKQLKKYLGLVWMIAGPLVIFTLLKIAIENIDPHGKADINRPIPWIIVIGIFTPIAAGLSIFGWYSWKGEYDQDIKS